jgi:hypothetical protein
MGDGRRPPGRRRHGDDVVELLYHHNLKSPDEVAIFSVPFAGVRRWDEVALVYDVRVRDDAALRHYAFPDRWFVVNCSLELDGQFLKETGPIDFSFNCDVTTPCFSVGRNVYIADLELDVLVAPEGRDHLVVDEEEFAQAVDRAWITPAEAIGARRGLEELLGLITSGTFLAFLEEICPFESTQDLPVQPSVTFRTLSDAPLLHPGRRHSYFGQRLPDPP